MKRNNIIISCLILLLFIASFCIILSNSFSRNQNITKDEELIGTYIDGEYSENIPNKDTGYVVEKIVCDNNATGEWDYENWGITLTNLSEKNKCNIHFRKGVKLADTINLVATTGKCPTVNDDGTVNVTSAESENSLLCSAPDNYGNSYYFRGNVQNNYVKFANFYWRIVRINGDNSIRLIYDGTVAHANGETSDDRIIGTSAFNEKNDDNAYVGYMYGTIGASTYEKTHENVNDSTIKKYLDIWYEQNIKDTNYEQYLLDNVFCNDRSLTKESIGYGFEKITSYYRWFNTPWSGNILNKRIFLNCNQINDTFTVEDIIGNKKLKYSIGLINMDEVTLAGAFGNEDLNNNYIVSGVKYWTMSSAYFEKSEDWAYLRRVGDNGDVDNRALACYNYGVKPVINLKPNSLKSGDGTINNPYTVE